MTMKAPYAGASGASCRACSRAFHSPRILLAAYYCAFDRATPLRVKATLIGAIAYFVLPVDAIPDVLPVIGFTDDAAVLAATIKLVSSHIRPVHRDAARDAFRPLRSHDRLAHHLARGDRLERGRRFLSG